MKRLILIQSLILVLSAQSALAQESTSGMAQRLGEFARSILGNSPAAKAHTEEPPSTSASETTAGVETSGSSSPGVYLWSNTNPPSSTQPADDASEQKAGHSR